MLLSSIIFPNGRPKTARSIPDVDTPGAYKYTMFYVLFFPVISNSLIPAWLLIILYQADGFIELCH